MTKTPNINLNVPDYQDERWDIPVNENWNLLDTAIAGKQATLTFDTTPTSGSSNPVTSGGIYNAIQNIDALPSQTGQSGKFLTTNGTDASWANVDALPSQTGQSGKFLTTDGSSASWETVSVNPDNKSITLNGSSQLQTVGVIDQNNTSNAIKTWAGTRAQYDAIATKDPNTLYNITDDTDLNLPILEALYPVGSVFMTYNSVCPLSALISGSTWTLESTGVVTSVDTNVPVKGNGKTLGLTNGTDNVGAVSSWGNSGFGIPSSLVRGTTDTYGVNVGTSSSEDYKTNIDKSLGVTTDACKSGIVGTVTRSVSTINIFRRTA